MLSGRGQPVRKRFVDVRGADGFDDFLFVGPELELVRFAASQCDGQRRAPGAGANDCNVCHENYAFLAPKRLSVPAHRRPMFW